MIGMSTALLLLLQLKYKMYKNASMLRSTSHHSSRLNTQWYMY